MQINILVNLFVSFDSFNYLVQGLFPEKFLEFLSFFSFWKSFFFEKTKSSQTLNFLESTFSFYQSKTHARSRTARTDQKIASKTKQRNCASSCVPCPYTGWFNFLYLQAFTIQVVHFPYLNGAFLFQCCFLMHTHIFTFVCFRLSTAKKKISWSVCS